MKRHRPSTLGSDGLASGQDRHAAAGGESETFWKLGAGMGTPSARRARWLRLVFFLVVGAVMFLHAMTNPFDHDEHQFIVPAVMLERGLLPSVDYLYTHLPTQIFLLVPFTVLLEDPLLAGRVFSAVVGFGVLVTLDGVVRRAWPTRSPISGLLVGASLIGLLLSSHMAAWTLGRSWNHASSVWLTLLALLALVEGGRRRWLLWIALSGGLLGLAIGCRLTVAPLMAPFGLALLWLAPAGTLREWIRHAALAWTALGAGLVVGLTPVWGPALLAPERFYLGAVEYHVLSGEYHRWRGEPWDWQRKWRATWSYLSGQPGLVILLALTVAGWAWALGRRWWRDSDAWRVALAVACVTVFVLIGAYTPGRTNRQYHFAPFIFLILNAAIAWGWLACRRKIPPRVLAAALLLTTLGVMAHQAHTGWMFPKRFRWFTPSQWTTQEADALAAAMFNADPRLRAATNRRSPAPDAWGPGRAPADARSGQEAAEAPRPSERSARGGVSKHRHRPPRVWTLAPTFTAMAGYRLPPPLTNSPFVWRVAPLLTPALRERHEWFGPEDLTRLEDSYGPPDTILTGVEIEYEDALVKYARRSGYRPIALPPTPHTRMARDPILWIRPDGGSKNVGQSSVTP